MEPGASQACAQDPGPGASGGGAPGIAGCDAESSLAVAATRYQQRLQEIEFEEFRASSIDPLLRMCEGPVPTTPAFQAALAALRAAAAAGGPAGGDLAAWRGHLGEVADAVVVAWQEAVSEAAEVEEEMAGAEADWGATRSWDNEYTGSEAGELVCLQACTEHEHDLLTDVADELQLLVSELDQAQAHHEREMDAALKAEAAAVETNAECEAERHKHGVLLQEAERTREEQERSLAAVEQLKVELEQAEAALAARPPPPPPLDPADLALASVLDLPRAELELEATELRSLAAALKVRPSSRSPRVQVVTPVGGEDPGDGRHYRAHLPMEREDQLKAQIELMRSQNVTLQEELQREREKALRTTELRSEQLSEITQLARAAASSSPGRPAASTIGAFSQSRFRAPPMATIRRRPRTVGGRCWLCGLDGRAANHARKPCAACAAAA